MTLGFLGGLLMLESVQVLDRMFDPHAELSRVSRALMKGTMLGGIKVARGKIWEWHWVKRFKVAIVDKALKGISISHAKWG